MALTTTATYAPLFRNTIPFPISNNPATLLETAEAAFLRSQITAASRFYPHEKFTAVSVGRGQVAGATKKSFDWKLNRVVGFGMHGPVSEENLDEIEHIARDVVGLRAPLIDLCPFAHSSAWDILKRRGYYDYQDVNVHFMPLQESSELSYGELIGKYLQDDIEITRVSTEQDRCSFIQSSLAGFEVESSRGEETELLRLLAHCATVQPDTRTYLAKIDGQIAGSAGMAFLPTPQGPVAQLHISSTVPELRGRGVQGALLRARLADAKASGIETAVVNTRPGSASVRNVGRAGFRLAYVRGTWTKDV
ncbi:GNAT family N-acetyltransferase [Aspergillus stella-maris]|uniref:GNAT family N-acetyltransferase n=1 Tax=Aspergillus stella-maris TaxID=1810926 RepID=UPI003CCDF59D